VFEMVTGSLLLEACVLPSTLRRTPEPDVLLVIRCQSPSTTLLVPVTSTLWLPRKWQNALPVAKISTL
jgi:hypothetical protein